MPQDDPASRSAKNAQDQHTRCYLAGLFVIKLYFGILIIWIWTSSIKVIIVRFLLFLLDIFFFVLLYCSCSFQTGVGSTSQAGFINEVLCLDVCLNIPHKGGPTFFEFATMVPFLADFLSTILM